MGDSGPLRPGVVTRHLAGHARDWRQSFEHDFPVDAWDPVARFIRDVLGWEITSWGGPVDYWLATTGPDDEPGINGALTRRSEASAWIHVGVDSVDDAIRRIEEAGGSALTPKMPIPGVGYMAYCRDTEGNSFGVYEDDPSAA